MKKQAMLLLAAPALTAALSPAFAQTPSQTLPAGWTNAQLATATYVILDPQITGNPGLFSADQRKGLIDGMRRDSAGALKRHYPNATISTDASAANAIQVTPVMVTPGSLLPWNKVTVRLDFRLPGNQNVVLAQDFGLLTLWQQQGNAANYAYDLMTKRLP